MPITRDKLFDNLKNDNTSNYTTSSFERLNGIPIDRYSVFKSYDEAVEYATSDPTAYPGQYIAVIPEEGEPVPYIIRKNGSLQSLIETGNAVPLTEQEYEQLVAENKVSLTTYYYIYEETT